MTVNGAPETNNDQSPVHLDYQLQIGVGVFKGHGNNVELKLLYFHHYYAETTSEIKSL